MRLLFGVKALSNKDIRKYTSNFSEDNFITKFQYGKVYRGRNGLQELTVKIWSNDEGDENGHVKFFDELFVLCRANFKGHPRPIGFCENTEKPCAIVYDFNPVDTLHNLIPNDNFSWLERIKVALGFALTLRSCHNTRNYPLIIRNISAAHILCDQDYTPVLCDFSMVAGRFFGHRWKFDERSGYHGYIDPFFTAKGRCWTQTDVFAYGVLLLALITKRASSGKHMIDEDSNLLYKWAENEYTRWRKRGMAKPSLVDQSLKSHPQFDSGDGHRVTHLAMQCIKFELEERPEMDEVIEILKTLTVVQKHIDENDLNKALERYGY